MDRLLSSEQLAERYGLPVNTIKYWRRQGTGPKWFRVGKHVRYRESDVADYEAGQVEKQSA